jgi:hypothetical protein
VFAAFVIGCGGDDSAGTTGTDGGSHDSGGGSDGQADSSAMDSGSDSSSSDSSADSAMESGAMLTCASYCTTLMANCTAANAQFTGMDNCLTYCASYPTGMLSDMSGATLGCHLYHAGAAGGSAANATLHCPHAGPTGGDKSPTGTAGVCGEPCDSFCAAAQAICTGTNKQFADVPTCVTACKTFTADTASYNISDTSKNDMGCRFYHVSAAAGGGTLATTHCPHIVPNSSVCTM